MLDRVEAGRVREQENPVSARCTDRLSHALAPVTAGMSMVTPS